MNEKRIFYLVFKVDKLTFIFFYLSYGGDIV